MSFCVLLKLLQIECVSLCCQVNTLNKAVLQEFTEVIDKVQKDAAVKSAVLISKKPDCFIAGADIKWAASTRN